MSVNDSWDDIVRIAKILKKPPVWVGVVVSPEWYEQVIKPIQFELLYGKDSYEKFIFGGAPGL